MLWPVRSKFTAVISEVVSGRTLDSAARGLKMNVFQLRCPIGKNQIRGKQT